MRSGIATAVRRVALLLAVGSVVFGLLANAAAQNPHPKDEVFGGYSVLFPNGWGDLDYKINTIPNAFDASNTYYFPGAHNLGVILDGSGHFKGSTTPPNLENGSNDSTGVGYALAGVQYKWHHPRFSPFVRGLVGAADISPDCCHGGQWSFAAGGGGGVDWSITRRFSIRLIQADYIYSHYSHVVPYVPIVTPYQGLTVDPHPTQWNSVRLAAGVVFSFGNYNAQRLVSCAASASPSEVNAGEPVRLSSTGSNFDPKHALTYGWTSSGGKITNRTSQTSEIDTTGLAPGSYTVSSTLTDAKVKSGGMASCTAAFLVKTPPVPVGPKVKCVPPDTTINAGETATLSMVATNPDNRPLTFSWTTTGGQLVSGGDSAKVTASNNDAGSTITVTGTVADDRSLSDSCNITVRVPKLPPPCVKLVDWGECTFEKDPRRPWRVDNDCKDVLDQLALKLQSTPNGTLVIVGYADASEQKRSPKLSAQRAANVQYYLVTDGPNKLDAGRMQAHDGGVQDKTTHFYLVPDGTLCEGQANLGSAIDQGKVKGQTRGAPPHKQKATAVKAD